MQLLADLKEAWDRLNQGPENSSRPPSSRAPWERTGGGSASADDAADDALMPAPADVQPVDVQPTDPSPKRKPGKQPGAPGSVGLRGFMPMRNRRITRSGVRDAVSH
ncbi:MAG: hypothetical protein IPL59_10015 [Candidatus Competibacteraceae bacterium]|nr:hypothetical protein [Candidatus Competibacteraceae bacterium]